MAAPTSRHHDCPDGTGDGAPADVALAVDPRRPITRVAATALVAVGPSAEVYQFLVRLLVAT